MIELNGKLRLHERTRMSVTHVGASRLPVLVVDNFLGNPHVLIDYAAEHSVFDGVRDTFYPGSRAPISSRSRCWCSAVW